jgi:phosphatidylglycerophosphate synthase
MAGYGYARDMRSPSTDAAAYPTLRRRAALGFSLTAAAAVGAGSALAFAGLSPWAVAKALGLVVVLIAFSVSELPNHDRPSLGPANQITLGRAVLVAGMAALLGESLPEGSGWWVASIGSVAFGLDWLDGQIARRTGWSSPFGARLDMELDALTVLVLCGLAWQLDRAGSWILWNGALRYLFVAAAWVWPWMHAELPPDPRRRFVCGVQISTVLLCLLPWPYLISAGLAAAGTAVLTWSFAVDTLWLFRQRR